MSRREEKSEDVKVTTISWTWMRAYRERCELYADFKEVTESLEGHENVTIGVALQNTYMRKGRGNNENTTQLSLKGRSSQSPYLRKYFCFGMPLSFLP